MQADSERARRSPFQIPIWLGFCLFLAIAVFFLWTEHRAHLLGALPYVLLLLCPAIHFFMHRGHGDHGGAGLDREGQGSHQHGGGGAS